MIYQKSELGGRGGIALKVCQRISTTQIIHYHFPDYICFANLFCQVIKKHIIEIKCGEPNQEISYEFQVVIKLSQIIF